MKLWLVDGAGGDYDMARSFVIRAESESRARQIAADNGGSRDDPKEWLTTARCVELLAEGYPEGVVCCDFYEP